MNLVCWVVFINEVDLDELLFIGWTEVAYWIC